MSEDGSTSKKRRLRPYWWFLIGALVLVILNAFLEPMIAKRWKVPCAWSWLQFGYGLISAEICAAVYFYGVGSLSPHWRPDAPSGDAGAKATLLAATPAGGSHPLGPRMKERVRPASGEAAGTQTIAVQALVTEKKPDAGEPGS
jgi:hypothetical protein